MSKFKDTMRNLNKNVQMSKHERELMHGRIREYMAHTPLQSAPRQARIRHTHVTWFSYRFSAALLVLALVFTSGIGVSYASTDALPGETLYSVKELHERVVETLITNPRARAAYAIERAHRRLQEAEALAAEGKLNAETEVIIAEKFAQLTEHAQEQITAVAQRQPEEAEALRVALEVGTQVRAETLALRVRDIAEASNEARTRIARIAHAQLGSRIETVGTATMSDVGGGVVREDVRVAVAEDGESAGAETATMMAVSVADDTTVNEAPERSVAFSATRAPAPEVTTMQKAVPAQQYVSFEHVEALLRELDKHIKVLKNTEGEGVEEALEEVTEMRASIVAAIERGAYTQASSVAREALRHVYTARVRSEVHIEIRDELPRIQPTPIEPDALPRDSVELEPSDLPFEERAIEARDLPSIDATLR